jgi:hypothetical protein
MSNRHQENSMSDSKEQQPGQDGGQQSTQGQPGQPDQPVQAGGQDNRSDALLPGDDGFEDGRFDVAEEVSLDQNSDSARRIGQAPDGIADALPDALKTPPATQPVPDKS